MSRFLFAASVMALALAVPVRAEEEVAIGPVPEWVVQQPDKKPAKGPPAPAAADAAEETPVKLISADYQLRLEPDRQTQFSALAMKFLTPQGLSAGNISLPWHPDTESITVHSVKIRRGDEVIDVLGEGQTFTVLRREQSLELATLNGVLTANMFPAGLEVGDTLEFSYSIVSSHPVLKGHAEASIGPLNLTLGKLHMLAEWPEGVDMQLTQSRDLPAWQRSKRDGMQVAQVTVENLQPIIPPRFAPARYGLIRLVEASDFASWDAVGRLFVPLYAEASQIPADGKLREELERIRAASGDPLKRAELALDLVQDKVRYVALAMGEGGLKPSDAVTTWQRRYGDCKAKTALLLGLLHELGIEAEPVLVNSVLGDSLPVRLPTVGAFDHVLVRATIGGREYWLDGTRSGDRTLADLTVPAFDWGLPVREHGTGLVQMMPPPLAAPTEDLAIRIDATGGLRLPAQADVELVLRKDAALSLNATFANIVGSQRKDALERYWRGEFDFITPDKVDMRFDEAAGELHLTLSGKAKMDWDGVWYEADKMRVGYAADFTRTDGPDKDAPFLVAYPLFDRAVETILLPPGFTQEQVSGDAIDTTVGGTEYHREAKIEGNVFTATRTVRSLGPEFPAADAPAAEKKLAALKDERLYIKMPGSYRASKAELDQLTAEDIDDVQGLIDRGVSLLDSQRYDEALADFDRASVKDPDNAWAWANRGMALVWKQDTAAAEQAFARAEALDADNPVMLRGRGVMAAQARDFGKAEKMLRASLKADPNNAFAHHQLALALFGANDLAGALAEADRTIELSPGFGAPYMMRPVLLMNLKRPDEAVAAVDALVKAFPNNSEMLAMASNLYDMLGKEDKSKELLGTAAATAETPFVLLNRANRRPVSETDQKLADLTKALQLDPKYVPALLSRGNTLWMDYKFKAALADVEKAIAIDPKAVQAYEIKAKILIDTDRRKDAAATAEQLLTADPDNPMAYFMAANIYERLGLAKEARAVREKQIGLKLPSPTAEALVVRAGLRDPADTANREQDIDAALALDPNSLRALTAKAGLQADRNDWEGAAKTLAHARELAKDDARIATLAGIALAKAGHDADATGVFDEARKLAVTPGELNDICYMKAMRGAALDRALDECNAALALAPNAAATLDSRGFTLLRLGRMDEARSDFTRANEQRPGVPNTLYGRAIARALLGDLKGAREDSAAALRIAPEMEKTFRGWGVDIPAAIAVK